MFNIFIFYLQFKFLTFLLLRFSPIDAVRRAVKIMKSSYQGAWIRWADVPEERKRQWFIGFKVFEILALFSFPKHELCLHGSDCNNYKRSNEVFRSRMKTKAFSLCYIINMPYLIYNVKHLLLVYM